MTDHSSDQVLVSVVLPCLNEEESVGLCVKEALTAIESAGWSGEVVVVDNGCTDNSVAVALAAGAVVVREVIPGYGAAILRGISESRGDVVVMADADLTYPLDRLAELVKPVLEDGVDIMIGSRLESATMQSMPFLHRYLGTPALTWLIRRSTGHTHLSDSQSGFRAFRRDRINGLRLRATGMEFASEMLVRAAQMSLVLQETPLGYRERVGESKLSTWRDGKRHLKQIIKTSPNLLLWYPGLVLLGLGIATSVYEVVSDETKIGSLKWQPIFLGPILLTWGLIATLSGAVMTRFSPWATSTTRRQFTWVTDRRMQRKLQILGIVIFAGGTGIDLELFISWLVHGSSGTFANIPLASFAQSLLLDGAILFVAVSMFRFFTSHFDTAID
jgi:glycosyltransferase involved in cell wall biosynthesis